MHHELKNNSKAEVITKLYECYQTDSEKVIRQKEFMLCLSHLGYANNQLQPVFEQYKNSTASVDTHHFSDFITHYNDENKAKYRDSKEYFSYQELQKIVREQKQNDDNQNLLENGYNDSEEAESEEDDGEMPEDLMHLSPKEQQKWLIIRSLYTMAAGTAIVMIFSDPMVAVFNSMGTALSIDSFYIAFFLAPLASNAKEWVASWNYSSKKTRDT